MSSQYELLEKPMPKLSSTNKKAWIKLFAKKLSLLSEKYRIEAIDGQPQWNMLALAVIYSHIRGFRPAAGGRPQVMQTPEAILGRAELLNAVNKKKHEHREKNRTVLSDWSAWEIIKKPKSSNNIPMFYLGKTTSMPKGTLKAHLALARKERQEQDAIMSLFADSGSPRGLGYYFHPQSPGNIRSDGKP